LAADDKLIAQQLTLLDFETFKRIQVHELIGHPWLKASKRHAARNILDHIRRLNSVR
jgi:hypothetical protein